MDNYQRLKKSGKLRQFNALIIRWVLLFSYIFFSVPFFIMFLLAVLISGYSLIQSQSELVILIVQIIALLLIIPYLGLFLIPFLITLPFIMPVILSWRRPNIILLLRPFGQWDVNTSLKRIIRNKISRYGHTYTLADSEMKIPFYVRIIFLLGQISLFSFRFRKIKEKKHVDRLIRVTEQTGWRIINWCVMKNKIFPVLCNENSWKLCVELMMKQADLILIDLTELRDAVLWEVDMCIKLGLMDRVILLSHQDVESVSQNWINKNYALKEYNRQMLFIYNQDGILTENIEDVLFPLFANKKNIKEKYFIKYFKPILVCLSMLAISLYFFWLSLPKIFPTSIAKYSPSITHVTQVYCHKDNFTELNYWLHPLYFFGFHSFPEKSRVIAKERLLNEFRKDAQTALFENLPNTNAIQLLGELGAISAIDTISSILRSKNKTDYPDEESQKVVVEAMEKLHTNLDSIFINHITSKNEIVRKNTIKLIGKYGGKSSQNIIIDFLNDTSRAVQNIAASTLGDIEKPLYNIVTAIETITRLDLPFWYMDDLVDRVCTKDYLNDFLKLLNSNIAKNREIAAKALGRIGDRRAIKALINALNDESLFVRTDAETSLSMLINKRDVQWLCGLVNHEHLDVEYFAKEELQKLGSNCSN